MATIPAGRVSSGELRDVFTSCLEAVLGHANPLRLPPLRHAAVVLVDGLGAEALAARAGHARTLSAGLTKRGRIVSGFPTTTASGLASLLTGTDPGEHGLVGYTALDPASGRVINQLHGFDDGTLRNSWQRSRTIFERAADAGVRGVAIGPQRNADSGFSQAVLRGAEYLGARTIADRFAILADVFATPASAIAYVYVPELDQTAHAAGWQSPRWTAHLEAVDAAVAETRFAAGDGMLVTADHGILDVPADRHHYFAGLPGLMDDVSQVAGEPRCVQLHLRPGADAEQVAALWRSALAGVATVTTRDDAIAQGWFGTVDDAVIPRIGDLLVVATGRAALFAAPGEKAEGMVGHHGGFSSAERIVPLLRFGAAAR